MKSVTITNKVKNGRLNENQSVVKALKNFEGKIIEIVIRLKKKNRSSSQNSYYWASKIEKEQLEENAVLNKHNNK